MGARGLDDQALAPQVVSDSQLMVELVRDRASHLLVRWQTFRIAGETVAPTVIFVGDSSFSNVVCGTWPVVKAWSATSAGAGAVVTLSLALSNAWRSTTPKSPCTCGAVQVRGQKTAGTAPEDLLVTAFAASRGRSARTAAWTTTDPHIDGQVDQCRCHNAPGTGAVCRPPQAA